MFLVPVELSVLEVHIATQSTSTQTVIKNPAKLSTTTGISIVTWAKSGKCKLTAAKIIKPKHSVDQRQIKWQRVFLFRPGRLKPRSDWANQGKVLRQP